MADKVIDIIGAYGRKYQNAEAALRDWTEGKDFRIISGPYCSINDVPRMLADGYTHVAFWYHERGEALSTGQRKHDIRPPVEKVTGALQTGGTITGRFSAAAKAAVSNKPKKGKK